MAAQTVNGQSNVDIFDQMDPGPEAIPAFNEPTQKNISGSTTYARGNFMTLLNDPVFKGQLKNQFPSNAADHLA
jgi:hypothetical protein